jgi:hypothetical protein
MDQCKRTVHNVIKRKKYRPCSIPRELTIKKMSILNTYLNELQYNP